MQVRYSILSQLLSGTFPMPESRFRSPRVSGMQKPRAAALLGMLLASLALCGFFASWAEASSSYQITKTARSAALLGDVDLGNHGDDVVTTINFPFPIKAYNQAYSSGQVTSNGVFSFGTTPAAPQNGPLPTPLFSAAIFPLWANLDTSTAGYGIYTNLSGSMPNRTFAVRWKAALVQNPSAYQDFELRFHEGSPNFEILYASVDSGSGQSTVGTQFGNAEFTLYPANAGALTSTTQLNFTLKPVSLSVDDASVAESNGGVSQASFVVRLAYPVTAPVTVAYSTSDGSATSVPNGSDDYVAVPLTTLTFAPGETSKTVLVTVKGDELDELDETFTLNLSAPTNAVLADALALGKIVDNDTSLLVVTGDAITEANAGPVTLNFTVKLSVPNSRVVTFKAQTGNAVPSPTSPPATAAIDYVALPATSFSLAPGETTKIVPVTVNGDTLDELNELVGLTLSAPVNATVGSGGTGTILDDDAAPIVTVGDVTLTEGNAGYATAAFTVNLSTPSGQAVSVDYITGDNSALAGSDYTALPLTRLTFLPGQTSKTVNVLIRGDSSDELDESFWLHLSAPVNATLGDSTGVGTIVDDDTSTFSVIGPAVKEGNSGTVPMNFTVKLSAPNSRAVTVKAQTIGPTSAAASPPIDYTAIPLTTIYFAPGETTKVITVSVNGDTLSEADERIGLVLSDPTNALLGSSSEGVILNDDAIPVPTPSLSISDASIAEGNNGTQNVSLTVTLSAASDKTVTVMYATSDDSATAGVDYLARTLTQLTFLPGQTSQNISFTINGDTLKEGDEKFNALLSSPVGATLADDGGVVTLLDDDNRAPNAIDDYANLGIYNRGTTISGTIDAVSNDQDADGDRLTIISCTTPTGTNVTGASARIVGNKIVFTIPNVQQGATYAGLSYTISDGFKTSTGNIDLNFAVRYP